MFGEPLHLALQVLPNILKLLDVKIEATVAEKLYPKDHRHATATAAQRYGIIVYAHSRICYSSSYHFGSHSLYTGDYERVSTAIHIHHSIIIRVVTSGNYPLAYPRV